MKIVFKAYGILSRSAPRLAAKITASRFLNIYQPLNRPQTSSSIKSVFSNATHGNKPYLTGGDLRNLNVFAEVRGKYARPPPVNHKKSDIQILSPKENSIIARPTTSGSLKPRSSSYNRKPGQKEPEKPSEVLQSKQYNKRYRSVNHNDESKKPQEIDHILFDHSVDNIKEEEPKSQEIPQGEIEDQEENYQEEERDEVKDLEKLLNEIREKGSQITTSSQRKYILELESSLREEKLRRIKLEETLKNLGADIIS
ncbi:hypothetical protein SteCoe_5713 [Stentor coeruleus]|uniref:Uncharacterized protein n=1 Tax=Stentor coeruleus TaxID=5963 RepID=A0A1R2CRQ3_9CILI|nr:hypothetical protein SteCoe_5713 [Stentor coeruleus]